MTRILVVEDEPYIQTMICKVLTKLGGYDVTITEDVEQGLDLARSGTVALVVMDVSLANSAYQGEYIDGLAFTRLLKADLTARAVPVLLATAHALPGDAERLRAACNADGYIAKPFVEPKELVEKVRGMLNGR